jgi:hypothetical protein
MVCVVFAAGGAVAFTKYGVVVVVVAELGCPMKWRRCVAGGSSCSYKVLEKAEVVKRGGDGELCEFCESVCESVASSKPFWCLLLSSYSTQLDQTLLSADRGLLDCNLQGPRGADKRLSALGGFGLMG